MANKKTIRKFIAKEDDTPKVLPFGLQASFQLHLQGIDYQGKRHDLHFGKGKETLFAKYPNFIKDMEHFTIYGKVLYESFLENSKKEQNEGSKETIVAAA